MKEIGAYEAKTKLSNLLRQVSAGHEFLITNHGRGVARLTPVAGSKKRPSSEVIEEILSFRTKKDCSHLSTQALKEVSRR